MESVAEFFERYLDAWNDPVRLSLQSVPLGADSELATERQRTSLEELHAFVRRHRYAVVATASPDQRRGDRSHLGKLRDAKKPEEDTSDDRIRRHRLARR